MFTIVQVSSLLATRYAEILEVYSTWAASDTILSKGCAVAGWLRVFPGDMQNDRKEGRSSCSTLKAIVDGDVFSSSFFLRTTRNPNLFAGASFLDEESRCTSIELHL